MIENISIENYAIIEKLNLDFTSGFSVFTGETGAGKSIIVGALSLLLGARADSSIVRTGAETAKVSGFFSVNTKTARQQIEALGVDLSEGLIIRREISVGGKSKAFINGNMEPVSKLAEIGEWLVDLHGQHDHQQLLNQKAHIHILDEFAGISNEKEKLRDLFLKFKNLQKEMDEFTANEEKMAAEKMFWEAAVSDIEKANFEEDEEESLKTRFEKMEHAEKIRTALSDGYHLLLEAEVSADSRLRRTVSSLQSISSLDSRYGELLDILQDAAEKVTESARLLADYRDEMGFDESSVDEISDRLALIRDLKRKYKKTELSELIAYGKECREKLSRFENRDEELEKLTRAVESEKAELIAASLALSKKRQSAAKELQEKISGELHFLGMQSAVFIPEINYVKEENSPFIIDGKSIRIGSDGMDRVEFLITANAGEEPRALRKVASGGEISRVMLAMKSILANSDSIETLIFDEIDSGIGGVTANNVAEKMRSISEKKQLLSITHLPQIASKASTQFYISKTVQGNQTMTGARPLSAEERVNEIARMLGGESEASKVHAREMLGF